MTVWNPSHYHLWACPLPGDKSTAKSPIDYFIPKNPISGSRQFNFIPIKLESWLGNLSHLALFWRHPLSLKQVPNRALSYQKLADEILAKLEPKVPSCYGKAWNFKVNVIKAVESNASAIMGGKIYINDNLIDDIYNFCRESRTLVISTSNNAKTSIKVQVDESKAEGILAFVIGHEMTHICARHTTRTQTIYRLVLGALFCLRLALRCASDSFQAIILFLIDKPPITKFSHLIYAIALVVSALVIGCLPARLIKFFDEEYIRSDAQLSIQSYSKLIGSSVCYLTAIKLFDLMTFHFDRLREFECDRWGMRFAASAKFDPRGALIFQEMMEQSHMATPKSLNWILNINSTHPNAKRRKAALADEINKRDLELLRES